jgi:hypothetical protein
MDRKMKLEKIQEAIKKYSISLAVQDGQEGLKLAPPKSAKIMDEIKVAKPEIIAELKRQQEDRKAANAIREAKWAEQRAAQDAIDAPLLAAMQDRANDLRAQIPADHIEVVADKTGDMDGAPIMQYTANGEIVSWQDINVVGWASAIRPGAMGSFASVQICSIGKDKLEQIKADKIVAANKKADEEKTETDRVDAIFVTAKETGVKQQIRHYMADCNDPQEECSTDVVTVYAMPDGTTKSERQHTW